MPPSEWFPKGDPLRNDDAGDGARLRRWTAVRPRLEGGPVRQGGFMRRFPLLRLVDSVTIPVPDLEAGLRLYRDVLGHELLWRHDSIGQAGLRLPEAGTELVLSTRDAYAPNWLVTSVAEAVAVMLDAGGELVLAPTSIPVGRLAVVNDPFGNTLVLLDLSSGCYTTDATGHVTGVAPAPGP